MNATLNKPNIVLSYDEGVKMLQALRSVSNNVRNALDELHRGRAQFAAQILTSMIPQTNLFETILGTEAHAAQNQNVTSIAEVLFAQALRDKAAGHVYPPGGPRVANPDGDGDPDPSAA